MDDFDLMQCEDYYGEETPFEELYYIEFIETMEIIQHEQRTKETT